MKLIIFAIPNSIPVERIAEALSKEAKKLGFKTDLHVMDNCDFGITEFPPQLSQIQIIEDLVACCGNPNNRLNFTTNFYRAVSEGFGSNRKDVKIILKELIDGKNIPEVKQFAKDSNVSFIFELAERTLGMLR